MKRKKKTTDSVFFLIQKNIIRFFSSSELVRLIRVEYESRSKNAELLHFLMISFPHFFFLV